MNKINSTTNSNTNPHSKIENDIRSLKGECAINRRTISTNLTHDAIELYMNIESIPDHESWSYIKNKYGTNVGAVSSLGRVYSFLRHELVDIKYGASGNAFAKISSNKRPVSMFMAIAFFPIKDVDTSVAIRYKYLDGDSANLELSNLALEDSSHVFCPVQLKANQIILSITSI